MSDIKCLSGSSSMSVPGTAFTEDRRPEPGPVTALSDGTTHEQHAKDKKRKGIRGFFKKTWKAMKRPFSRSCHETQVETIVQDEPVPSTSGLQRKSDREQTGPCQPPTTASPPKEARADDLEVVRIIQQDPALPVDASAEDIDSVSPQDNEDQEQHTKEEKRKGKGGCFKRAWKALKRPFRRHRSKDRENNKQQESKKGKGGCFKRAWKALKLPFRRHRCKDRENNKQQESKKGKCGCFKRAWKALKRPFRRHRSKDRENNKQQGRKKGKCGCLKRTRSACRRLKYASIRRVQLIDYFLQSCPNSLDDHMDYFRCYHHHCCEHHHSCCLTEEQIYLGVREQILSTVPSVTRPFLNFPEQYRVENRRKERRHPVMRFRSKTSVRHTLKEQCSKEKKKKGIRGFFKRRWKAVKRPFRDRETRVEAFVEADPVPCASGLQQTAASVQIRSECSSVSVSTGTESVNLQNNDKNKQHKKRAEEMRQRTPLSVPPMFKPSDGIFRSLYHKEYVVLGQERLGKVSLVTRKSDGQRLAVKEVHRHNWINFTYSMAGYTDKVMTEVAMMTLLKQPPTSPYVIQMLEWFHEPFHTFIVMEDPGSCVVLRKLIDHNPLNEKIARVIMRQAVQAAQHCISHGVFHFNISADTILVNTSTLDIKLFDFGFSESYTGKIYHQRADDNIPYEYEYNAIRANVWQLGILLRHMIDGPHDPYAILTSRACRNLMNWCTSIDSTKRPTLEQILLHRWFTQGRHLKV